MFATDHGQVLLLAPSQPVQTGAVVIVQLPIYIRCKRTCRSSNKLIDALLHRRLS
jgi:hypothetical protein